MRLKRVTLVGFKSFADKTNLDFEGGVTAVVGPNGCGKSNIVDAFRWVMGETSAKSIRGDKMLDLIFAGTEKRKGASFAEVTLEFTEVSVTRRVHKSGESEYFINKSPVRLKDIESLFWDTGLGKNALCVFEQGKIDQVIVASPQERRVIFEEAAGILRFKERRRETMRRLELAEQNLLRAQDIHRIVMQQKEHLEKQAEMAKVYKAQKSRLEELLKALLYVKWKKAHEKKQGFLEKMQGLASSLEERRISLEQMEEKERDEKGSASEREKRLYALTEAFFQEQNQKELKAQALMSNKEKLKELRAQRGALAVTLKLGKEKGEAFEQEFLKEKKRMQEAEVEIVALRGKGKELQEERLRIAGSEMQLKGRVQEMRLKLETHKEKAAYLQAARERLKKHLEDLAKVEKEKTKAFDQLSKEVDEKKGELKKIESLLLGVEKELKVHFDGEKEIQRELTEAEAKKKALLGLKQDMEGFSQGAKHLVQAFKLKPLYEIVGADKKRAHALHVYSETLVVNSKKDLEKVQAFAKEKKIGGFSLFCKEVAKEIKEHFFKTVKQIAEDFYVDHNGVHFFPKGGEKNTFVREAALEELTQTVGRLQKCLNESHAKLKGLYIQRDESRSKKQELEKALRILEMKLVEVNFGKQRSIQDKEKALLEQQKSEQELKRIEGVIEEASQGILQWVEKEGSAREQSLKKSKLFQKMEEDLARLQEHYNAQEKSFKEKEEIFRKLMDAKEQEVRLKKEEETLLASLALLEEAYKKCEAACKEKDSALKKIKKEVEAGNHLVKHLEADCKKEAQAFKELEEKRHRLELLLAGEETILNQLGSVEEVTLDLSEEEMTKEHSNLKKSFDRMQEVNLGAIEEFEKQKKEEAFLREQLQDLQKSKEEILQIIKELDDESRKQFIETFAKIQENFKKNFALLFEGGEAELKPVENQDLLSAGIEIIAKPPGKQMRSISLLSGGEKCLTALALLFAIFDVKPAAFCLLDEVDAPLDEVNVDRFSRMIRAFSMKTQFIVITHNKRTMAIADRLHGISMEEKGVSKLVSIQFEHASAC